MLIDYFQLSWTWSGIQNKTETKSQSSFSSKKTNNWRNYSFTNGSLNWSILNSESNYSNKLSKITIWFINCNT